MTEFSLAGGVIKERAAIAALPDIPDEEALAET